MLERLSPKIVIVICLAIAFGSLFLRNVVYLSGDLTDSKQRNRRAIGSQPIILAYHERPPYYVTGNDSMLRGLVGDKALAAFNHSGLQFSIQKIPSKRQFSSIIHNRERICAVGWFKTPEREQFARFTLPLYQDRPTAVVTRSDLNLVNANSTIKSLFTRADLTLLTKSGYSYGEYVDNLLRHHLPSLETTTGTTSQMLAMLDTGKADYFLAAAEEAEVAIGASTHPARFAMFTPTDAPAGNLRFLMCSQQVSEKEITRLNTAITALRSKMEGTPLQGQ